MTENTGSECDPTLWFSAQGGRLDDSFPDFFDVADLPWAARVEAEWEVVRGEILDFIVARQRSVRPYFNQRLVSRPRTWMTASFLFWGLPLRRNQRHCPGTMDIISSIPGLVSASISMLEPGAEIYSHRGDTNAIYRCHLPLVVPAGYPECGFRVNRSTRPWQEGELLVFCDAARHSAWNRSDERRVLFLFDVVRPEFIGDKRRVCATVLSSLVSQFLDQRFPPLRRLSVARKSSLRRVIARLFDYTLRPLGV